MGSAHVVADRVAGLLASHCWNSACNMSFSHLSNDMFAACRYVAQHAFIITSYRLRRLCLPAHMDLINCMYAESAWRIQEKLKILIL